MLFWAENNDERFYVNPEDAKKYSDAGYKIMDIDNKHILTPKEISELKPVTIPITYIGRGKE